MSRRNVIMFNRAARRDPKWNLGGPKRPRRPRRQRAWGPFLGKIALFACVGLLVLPSLSDSVNGFAKAEGDCTPLKIVDGDTIKGLCKGDGFISMRLTGFDTPEIKAKCPQEQWLALKATYALRWKLITASEMVMRAGELDRYGRRLVDVWLDGVPLSRVMIRTGLARAYEGGQRQGWCDAPTRKFFERV